jgi:IS5 family transposase
LIVNRQTNRTRCPLRRQRDCQLPLTFTTGDHPHLSELQEISRFLDSRSEFEEVVFAALGGVRKGGAGRPALTAEQVLRAGLLLKMHDWTYRELEFELQFNQAYREFCRLSQSHRTSRSALQRDIKRLSARVWEQVNLVLLDEATARGVEDGRRVRSDCTVVNANIHHPTDSSLLFDCVRKLTDLLDRASSIVNVRYSNHRRAAKRRSLAISNAKRMEARKPLYRDLIAIAKKTVHYSKRALAALRLRNHERVGALAKQLDLFIGRAEKVIAQAHHRVIEGKSVPAKEKLVSIFEEHTDVIRKDARETLYGHKVCLSSGQSNLITDCVVLDGNPPDSRLAIGLLERHAEIFGYQAEQAAFDGGFASKANVEALKALGVTDVMFHKRPGIAQEDMVSSPTLYKALRRFRAGIEAVISTVKRVCGAGRCRWRGKRAFAAYVWSSVVAANFLALARRGT